MLDLGPAGLGLRVVRLDDLHQDLPRHHGFDLFEELALLRLLGREVQAKSELLHVRHRRRAQTVRQGGSARNYADLPQALIPETDPFLRDWQRYRGAHPMLRNICN